MKAVWTQHLSNEVDKEALRLAIRNSKTALEALTIVINRKTKKPKTADYDSPSWAYLRADQDGYNRALEEILDILNLDQKGKKT